MPSTKKVTISIVGALALTVAAQAHAELQTWRLEGVIDTVWDNDSGWTPPAGFRIGDSLTIDYQIDMDAPLDEYGYLAHAVKGVTINGESLEGSGYLSMRGLGLNTSIGTNSHDINFVSFNDNKLAFTYADEDLPTSVREALSLYSAHTALNASEPISFYSPQVRLDFGTPSYSVLSNPMSFAPVPEPATAGLLLLGLTGISLAARRARS